MEYIAIMAILAVAVAINVVDFLDGRNLILDFLSKLRLARRTLSEWDEYWAANPCRSDIVVCLTTTPSRIPHISQTLKSLLSQRRRPRKIRLHIPAFSKREQCAYEVPRFLENLQSLEIVPCDDLGPATKLIPALLDLPVDQKILVVDDDKFYPANMIDDFDHWSRESPDAAIGSSGWIVPEDLTDRATTLMSNLRHLPPAPLKSTRLRKQEPIDILQGYSGFLVKPGFFDLDRVTDYSEAPEAAFFVDDVWFSAHCRVPKYVFPAKRFCFTSWSQNRLYTRTSLGLINRGDGSPEQRNNTIVVRHFRDRWLLHRDAPPSA